MDGQEYNAICILKFVKICKLWIFTHLKLCLADAIHNFKWVKIIVAWLDKNLHLERQCCFNSPKIPSKLKMQSHIRTAFNHHFKQKRYVQQDWGCNYVFLPASKMTKPRLWPSLSTSSIVYREAIDFIFVVHYLMSV